MAAIPIFGAMAAGAVMAARNKATSESGYGAMATEQDPNVFAAGATAARRQQNTGPKGLQWDASQFVTKMPALIGR